MSAGLGFMVACLMLLAALGVADALLGPVSQL
jgi:hypothetical protein